MTDGDTDALAKLRSNVDRHKCNDMVTCQQLLWGKETAKSFLEKHAGGEQYDVFLASDVVYVAEIINPLFETVQTLLKTDGIFLFAYCCFHWIA